MFIVPYFHKKMFLPHINENIAYKGNFSGKFKTSESDIGLGRNREIFESHS